jgi:hypothetical protein
VTKQIIHCGKDNIEAFNGLLRENLPMFRPLLKAAIVHGLIAGIDGMKLEIFENGNPEYEQIVKNETAVKKCKTCNKFLKDTIGNGNGIGSCKINRNKNRLIWPNSEGCDQHDI